MTVDCPHRERRGYGGDGHTSCVHMLYHQCSHGRQFSHSWKCLLQCITLMSLTTVLQNFSVFVFLFSLHRYQFALANYPVGAYFNKWTRDFADVQGVSGGFGTPPGTGLVSCVCMRACMYACLNRNICCSFIYRPPFATLTNTHTHTRAHARTRTHTHTHIHTHTHTHTHTHIHTHTHTHTHTHNRCPTPRPLWVVVAVQHGPDL
jgi:hypothetical protein